MSGANRGSRFVGIALLVLLGGMTLLIARGIFSMTRKPQAPETVQTASRTPDPAPAASTESVPAQASAPETGTTQGEPQSASGPTVYRGAM